MSEYKSAIIVVIVAICMVAVTVPAVIVASQDDGGAFALDFDITEISDRLDNDSKDQIKTKLLEDTGLEWEFRGNHLGTDSIERVASQNASLYSNMIAKTVARVVKSPITPVLPDGTDVPLDKTIEVCNQFKLIETPRIIDQ